eukprot:2225697-Amphidinium_carterae.1
MKYISDRSIEGDSYPTSLLQDCVGELEAASISTHSGEEEEEENDLVEMPPLVSVPAPQEVPAAETTCDVTGANAIPSQEEVPCRQPWKLGRNPGLPQRSSVIWDDPRSRSLPSCLHDQTKPELLAG